MAVLQYKDEKILLDEGTGIFTWHGTGEWAKTLAEIHTLIDKSKKFKRRGAFRLYGTGVERVTVTSIRGRKRVRATDEKGNSYDMQLDTLYAVTDTNVRLLDRIETLQYAIKDFEEEIQVLEKQLEPLSLE